MRLGVEDAKIRSQLGVVFQNNVMDDLLSVKENLYCRGGLYGRTNQELDQHIRTISDVMKIDDILHRPFGRLSGGQKRRAEIARALMSEAKILILDEPTTGLDPQTRIHVWEIIDHLRAEFNMTVFLTTHYMEEAATADMVSVIDYGKIVAQGTPSQLKAKFSSDILKIALKNPEQGTEKLTEMNLPAIVQNGIHHIKVSDSLEAYRVLKMLEGTFDSFEVIHGNMDDVFVNITGHGIREAL
jgi:multidrug/hemolysin transport system ATP-binding protein